MQVHKLYKNLYSPLTESIGNIVDVGRSEPQPLPVVETPVITIEDTTATITCATEDATIYYTLDGSTPTNESTEYTEAITLTQSCTIKAIAVKSGMTDSEVASETYVAIEYLTAWELVGNSSVQSEEIWSCGELGQDSKYHVYIQSNGNVYDITLDEPLRKAGSVADTIELADGVAVLTRNLKEIDMGNSDWVWNKSSSVAGIFWHVSFDDNTKNDAQLLCVNYTRTTSALSASFPDMGIRITYNYQSTTEYRLVVRNESCSNATELKTAIQGQRLIFELDTPTTETITIPEIEVSSTDTYTQVISTGAHAVEWTSFTANPE